MIVCVRLRCLAKCALQNPCHSMTE
jgi:hypothetical protein